MSNWEGGTRGASFVAGGVIPKKMQGTICHETVHVTDYYATFAWLAGVDPRDPNTVGVHSDGTKFRKNTSCHPFPVPSLGCSGPNILPRHYW